MRFSGIVVAVSLLVSSQVFAAPLDLKLVSADARWLFLLDIDGIKTATKGKQAIDDFWAQNGPALAPLQEVLGLNLKRDLHGATLYANQISAEKKPKDFHGAAIFAIDFDRAKLSEKLKDSTSSEPKNHGKYLIYQWKTPADKDDSQTLCVAIHSSKGIVVARSIADVQHALDVLDGNAPNITQTDTSLATSAPVGTLLLVRGLDLENIASQLESPLLRQCKTLSLAIGEQDKHSFIDGQAWLKSADTAEQIEALVNGYRALIKLQSSSPDEITKVLGSVRCVRSDKMVSLSLRVPTGDLQEFFDAAGKMGMAPNATAKVQVEGAEQKGEQPKPGVKVKVGVQFGTTPPTDLPAKNAQGEKK